MPSMLGRAWMGISDMLAIMSELIAALAGAIVGGVIGFASSWGLETLKKRRESSAVREQVASLMKLLEARMTGMLNHDKWFKGYGWESADILVARVFSAEGTIAFVGVEVNGQSFFGISTEIQGHIVGVRDVIERMNQLEAAVQAGDYYQTGDARFSALFRELRSYAVVAQKLLRDSRGAIGDRTVVEDPIPREQPPSAQDTSPV